MTVLADVVLLGLIAILGEVVCRVFPPDLPCKVMQESRMNLHRLSDNMYLGYELRPGVAGHNAAGFRGPEVKLHKPPGVWRIAFVGDSVTYGLGVSDAEAFPRIVETRLRAAGAKPVEVLNFAAPAYNSFQEYTLLATKVLDYEPDLVVWVFSSGNTETSPVVLNVDGRMCLFRNQLEGFSPLNNRVHWTLFRYSRFYQFLYKRAVLAFAARGGRFDDVYRQPDVAWRTVLRAESLCRQRQVDFLLVLSPLLQPIYLPMGQGAPNCRSGSEMAMDAQEVVTVRTAMDRIRQLAGQAPWQVVDLGPLYDQYGAQMKLHSIDHEHLGRFGHQRVADLLADEIERRGKRG